MKSYRDEYLDELDTRMKLAGIKPKSRTSSDDATRKAGDLKDYDTTVIDNLSNDDLAERLSRMRSAEKHG